MSAVGECPHGNGIPGSSYFTLPIRYVLLPLIEHLICFNYVLLTCFYFQQEDDE